MPGSYYYHSGLTVQPGDNWLVPFDVDRPQPVIYLSISVTLVRGVRSSMTRADFNGFIIPVCNRIWHKAGIQFSLLDWQETPYGVDVHHSNSYRNPEAFDPDFLLDRRADLNVFILPYSSGVRGGICRSNMGAFISGRSPYIHSYITLYEEGEDPCIERRVRFNLGLLGRILSHEVGHSLSLVHVEGDDLRALRSLMYYGQFGSCDPLPGNVENLSPQEIAIARHAAVRLQAFPLRFPGIESLPPWSRWWYPQGRVE